MSIVRWVLLGVMAGFALVMILGWLGLNPLATHSAAPVMYHCPMHPTYVSSQPGDCPICGMTLVPIDSTREAKAELASADSAMAMGKVPMAIPKAKPGQYTCPMDPEVVSDKPGKCPICGMSLELVQPTSAEVSPGSNQSTPDMGSMPMPVNTPTTSAEVSPAGNQGMADMGSMPMNMPMTSSTSPISAEPSQVPGLVTITLEPKRLQLIGIKTGFVERRPLGGKVLLTGYVTPDEARVADVHVRVSGWVKKLYVDQTGQQMNAGEPLMSLYSQDLYQAQQDLILAAQATQRAGDKSLADLRTQMLNAARQRLHLLGLSDDEIAAIEASGKPTTDLTLKSPVTGVVLQKSITEGQYVGPDQSLFTIADLRKIWVLADVYEKDLGAVKVGMPATMTTTAGGPAMSGRVGFVYPVVSADTRTAKVRLEFDNPHLALRPGMYAEVSVATSPDSTLAVPFDAVMDGGQTKYVFVVHGGVQFEPRLVTVGLSGDNWYQVLSGLKPGEEVVTSANFLIDSESRLEAAITGLGGTSTESHEGHTH
ncbi:efflux RND transporter periplasmic adaptor subunit [candidate division GN15 bacterium]|uniref:Efflux RND transporter periplasmic adaptor subunit n=1 Tax=candidate division GN15 bacterium TaxID=2072418 RepID=A0A855WZF1_9BACT|nr:MAG: efflux RND transporter periplasmic adaptor subunit [candidate division GN15 bacterium]